MRRLAAVLTFVVLTLGLVALPATALAQTTSPTTPQGGGPNPLVSGPFTGTLDISLSPSCLLVHQVFDGAYLPTPVQSGRAGTFNLDGCASITTTAAGGIQVLFSGTFTLTAPNGATMTGTAAGTVFPLSITLTPTGGTQQFTNVGGVVNLTGTYLAQPGIGPISGSLAGALTR